MVLEDLLHTLLKIQELTRTKIESLRTYQTNFKIGMRIRYKIES